MLKNITSALQSIIQSLFPERPQEKIVSSLTSREILALPRASASASGAYSLFSYKNPRVQALIWELKYHRSAIALQIIGKLLAESIIEELADKLLFENITHALLVPIPVTSKHLRERTFSQTDLLCREIIKYLPQEISYAPHALKKIRETEKQSKTHSREERLQNLRGAFEADGQSVHAKNIILIDDVTTTGATVAEATRALQASGAKKIWAFTIAH